MPITETIAHEDNDRYTLFPIKYPDIWEKYQQHLHCFWTADEIDFTSEQNEFQKLTENEKYFIENILAFFAQADNVVIDNLFSNLVNTITIPECRSFYGIQIAIENIHAEVYATLIQTFIKDEERKNQLFHGMTEVPCVKKKMDWAVRWINSKQDNGKDLATHLFCFGIVEGIFFSGAFASIFYLKERNILLQSLGKSNEFISRDENLHCEFAALMYSKIESRLTPVEASAIVREAVECEQNFVTESLPVDLIGLSSKDMREYIEYIADRLLQSFGYDIIYGSNNPFNFMQKLSLEGKSNFFETRVTEYSIATNNNNTNKSSSSAHPSHTSSVIKNLEDLDNLSF